MRAVRDGGGAEAAAPGRSPVDRRRGSGGSGGSEQECDDAADAGSSQDEFHRLVGVQSSAAPASLERPRRRRLAALVHPDGTAVPYPSILVLTLALSLLTGLCLWVYPQRSISSTSTGCGGRSKDRGDGPTFVFTAGLEGTGHHFLNSLIKESPYVQRLSEHPEVLQRLAKMRMAFMIGIMMPIFNGVPMKDPLVMYQKLTQSLRQAHDLLRNSDIRYVPVNILTDSGVGHMLSYPDGHRMFHPNLDVFYAACREAGVRCGALYLHRDPYAVLRSTMRRHFYGTLPEGAHRYALMLQALYAQLAFAPQQTLACLGLYRDENATTAVVEDDGNDWDEWDPRPIIRDMFGWSSDPAAFDRYWAALQDHNASTPVSPEASLPLQPSDRVHVDAMVRAHNQVLQLCRRQVRTNREAYCD